MDAKDLILLNPSKSIYPEWFYIDRKKIISEFILWIERFNWNKLQTSVFNVQLK